MHWSTFVLSGVLARRGLDRECLYRVLLTPQYKIEEWLRSAEWQTHEYAMALGSCLGTNWGRAENALSCHRDFFDTSPRGCERALVGFYGAVREAPFGFGATLYRSSLVHKIGVSDLGKAVGINGARIKFLADAGTGLRKTLTWMRLVQLDEEFKTHEPIGVKYTNVGQESVIKGALRYGVVDLSEVRSAWRKSKGHGLRALELELRPKTYPYYVMAWQQHLGSSAPVTIKEKELARLVARYKEGLTEEESPIEKAP